MQWLIIICYSFTTPNWKDAPSAPENFSHVVDYSTANDSVVMVTLMWSATGEEVTGDVEYTLSISTDSTHTTHTTHTPTHTTPLELGATYLISLYSSTCQHTLVSNNFTTNITLQQRESTISSPHLPLPLQPTHLTIVSLCPPPAVPPGVVVSSVVEGSVIAYQCGEGLVSEDAESLQALCGADGNWSPDPTTLTCRNNITTENSVSEGNATRSTQSKESSTSIGIVLEDTTEGMCTYHCCFVASLPQQH